MKKLTFFTLVLLAGFLFVTPGCTKTDPEAEKANAEEALRAFYKAVETFDVEGMRPFFAEGFSVIENGTTYTQDEFLKAGENFAGYSGEIKMDIVKSEVVKELAFVVVKFDALWTKGPTSMSVKSIENYILKKVEGKWLIYFWQSTYLPDDRDRKYSSIHLLSIPDDATFLKADSLFKAANALMAKIGYPDCSYNFFKVAEAQGTRHNWVLAGYWKTPENYAVIHENEEMKKFYEPNTAFFKTLFKDEVYVKVAMP